MTGIAPVVTLSPRDYDDVLFDLDGVLTRTASVRAAASKRLFEAFLEQRAADIGGPFVPFDLEADYRARSAPGISQLFDAPVDGTDVTGLGLILEAEDDGASPALPRSICYPWWAGIPYAHLPHIRVKIANATQSTGYFRPTRLARS